MTRSSLVPFLLLLAVSCSGKEDGPSTGLHPLSGKDQEFCDRWAEAACSDEVLHACVVRGLDVDRCIDAQKDFCMQEAPDGRYDVDNAQDCIDAVRDAYEDAVLTLDEYYTVRRLVVGTPCGEDQLLGWEAGEPADEGDPCEAASDCNTTEMICVREDPEDDSGTCQVPRERSGGQTCTQPDQVCVEGFHCDALDSGYCIENPGRGGECCDDPTDSECEVLVPCRGNNYCDSDHVCAAKLEFGDDCVSPEQCSTELCFAGLCVEEIDLGPGVAICEDLGTSG